MPLLTVRAQQFIFIVGWLAASTARTPGCQEHHPCHDTQKGLQILVMVSLGEGDKVTLLRTTAFCGLVETMLNNGPGKRDNMGHRVAQWLSVQLQLRS